MRSRYSVAVFFKLVNIWVLFNAIMILVSYFPHWPLPLISWLNISLYYFAFLLALYIARADEFNREALMALAFLFFLYSVPSSALVFIGDTASLGSTKLSWIIYRYLYIFIQLVFSYSIVYFAAKNGFQPKRPLVLEGAVFVFVTVVWYFHFHTLILDPFHPSYNEILIHRKITYFLLPVFSMFVYAVLTPVIKPKHGEYSHALMAILTFLCMREFAISISEMKKIFLFGLDQYFLTMALVTLNIFLIKKMIYVYSFSGQIYAQLLHNKLVIPNLRLETRDKKEFTLFRLFLTYVNRKRNLLIPLFCIAFFALRYIDLPFIVSLNLIFMFLMAFLVIVFMIYTFGQKEKKDGFIITGSRQQV
jgi:hypothetical protein